ETDARKSRLGSDAADIWQTTDQKSYRSQTAPECSLDLLPAKSSAKFPSPALPQPMAAPLPKRGAHKKSNPRENRRSHRQNRRAREPTVVRSPWSLKSPIGVLDTFPSSASQGSRSKAARLPKPHESRSLLRFPPAARGALVQ